MKKTTIIELINQSTSEAYLVADPHGLRRNPSRHAKKGWLVGFDPTTNRVVVDMEEGEMVRRTTCTLAEVRMRWSEWEQEREGRVREADQAKAEQDQALADRKAHAEYVMSILVQAGLGIEPKVSADARSVSLDLNNFEALVDALFVGTEEAAA